MVCFWTPPSGATANFVDCSPNFFFLSGYATRLHFPGSLAVSGSHMIDVKGTWERNVKGRQCVASPASPIKIKSHISHSPPSSPFSAISDWKDPTRYAWKPCVEMEDLWGGGSLGPWVSLEKSCLPIWNAHFGLLFEWEINFYFVWHYLFNGPFLY